MPDIGVSMRQLLILSSLTLAVSAFDNAMQWLTDDLFNDQRYDKTLIPIEEAPMQSGENAVSLGIGLTLRNGCTLFQKIIFFLCESSKKVYPFSSSLPLHVKKIEKETILWG